MWEAFKTVPAAIGGWRQHRNLLYEVVASLAAVLVIASIVAGSRPSDSLAMFFHALGWTDVETWFGAGAPPFLAATNANLQSFMLAATLILLILMVGVSFKKGRQLDKHRFLLEPGLLLGSPAPATVWVLLLVAAQQGDISPVLHEWMTKALTAVFWNAVAVAIVAVISLFLIRHWFLQPGELTHWMLTVVYQLVMCLLFAACAVVFAALWFPVSIISWMVSLGPDRDDRYLDQTDIQQAKQIPMPTGSVSVTERHLRHVDTGLSI